MGRLNQLDQDDEREAIVVDGLRKAYPKGVEALAGVSFSVKSGGIFGLLGPNGAGKSTVMRILSTLTTSSGGRALVAGYDVSREPELVRTVIGYVAQGSGADKHATARENVRLQARLARVPSSRLEGQVARALEWTGLSSVADRMAGTLSGGMQRRLDIAMGLVHEPKVLFLDEPTTGLDPEARTQLWRDLARLKTERNLAVLLTTHYLEEADQLCDRIAIIDRGKVVIEGAPTDLKREIRGEVVTLEVEGEGKGVTELIQCADGAFDVKRDGASFVVRVAQATIAVPKLITSLEHGGVRVRCATLSRPSLDDVYLHHTGRRFASAQADAPLSRENGAAKDTNERRDAGIGGRA